MSCRVIAAEHLIPLSELGMASYRGEAGGLYGKGRNEPSSRLRQRAMAAIANIQPLDEAGKPSPDGAIVLLSIGMSNTSMEFSAFIPLANEDPRNGRSLC
jgi:hypothetical protein